MSEAQHHLSVSFTDQERQAMLSRLLRTIAHDMNNHLTVVSSFIQLVEDTISPSDELVADIEDATASIDSASELAGQLLTLSMPLDAGLSCALDASNEQVKSLMTLALGRHAKLIWRACEVRELTLGLSGRCWQELCIELAQVARQLQCVKLGVWFEHQEAASEVLLHLVLDGASLSTPLNELPLMGRVIEVVRAWGGDLERAGDASVGEAPHLVVKLPLV